LIRRIKYWEPDRYGNDTMVTISVELAVRFQKEYAATKNHTYPNDEEALIDYMVIHWAWFEGEG
jgi:hypothetical protein